MISVVHLIGVRINSSFGEPSWWVAVLGDWLCLLKQASLQNLEVMYNITRDQKVHFLLPIVTIIAVSAINFSVSTSWCVRLIQSCVCRLRPDMDVFIVIAIV